MKKIIELIGITLIFGIIFFLLNLIAKINMAPHRLTDCDLILGGTVGEPTQLCRFTPTINVLILFLIVVAWITTIYIILFKDRLTKVK